MRLLRTLSLLVVLAFVPTVKADTVPLIGVSFAPAPAGGPYTVPRPFDNP